MLWGKGGGGGGGGAGGNQNQINFNAAWRHWVIFVWPAASWLV